MQLLTSPTQTRVTGFRRKPSGRCSGRGRVRSMLTPGSRRGANQTASGRSAWPSRDPLGELGFSNGTVAALVHAADGTVAANDGYASFGEPVRVTGVMAKNNPFRFSTKYADDESDLLYYGYHYYKPSLRWQVSVWHTNSCRHGNAISPNPPQQALRNPFQTP